MDIYTIGHSNHAIEHFLRLLQQHQITLVVDVRTHPNSRYVPQFNAGILRAALAQAGLDYLHLPSLGGKPDTPDLQQPDGTPDYDRMQATAAFLAGIERLLKLAKTRRLALLCAESDPRQCHRERLIAPVLRAHQVAVHHILPDGALAAPPAQAALDFFSTGG